MPQRKNLAEQEQAAAEKRATMMSHILRRASAFHKETSLHTLLYIVRSLVYNASFCVVAYYLATQYYVSLSQQCEQFTSFQSFGNARKNPANSSLASGLVCGAKYAWVVSAVATLVAILRLGL